MDTMDQAWQSTPPMSNPFKALDAKLRTTASALVKWSVRRIGKIKLQILVATELTFRLDLAMETRHLSTDERSLHRTLKRKLLRLSSLERSIARQRSRLTWMKEGNVNTKFFQRHAVGRRRQNTMTSLHVEGSVVSGQEDLANAADNYFAAILGGVGDRAFGLDLDVLHVSAHDLAHLDAPITADEIWEMIKRLPADKAPGSDGFLGRFYTSCWSVIKVDFMRAIEHFSREDF